MRHAERGNRVASRAANTLVLCQPPPDVEHVRPGFQHRLPDGLRVAVEVGCPALEAGRVEPHELTGALVFFSGALAGSSRGRKGFANGILARKMGATCGRMHTGADAQRTTHRSPARRTL